MQSQISLRKVGPCPAFMKKRAQTVMAFTVGVSEMVKTIRQRL